MNTSTYLLQPREHCSDFSVIIPTLAQMDNKICQPKPWIELDTSFIKANMHCLKYNIYCIIVYPEILFKHCL